MNLIWLRNSCLFGLPLLLITISGLYFYADHPSLESSNYLQAAYTIILTANIGYFTNYIAIKMLFKPHLKSALGRQGLIPKNQDKLADSLSSTLVDNFLSESHWEVHLAQTDFIQQTIADLQLSTSKWIEKEQNIEWLHQLINELMERNQDSLNNWLTEFQTELLKKITHQADGQKILSRGIQWLETQFEKNPQQMQQLIEPIIRTLAENVPLIAKSLIQVVDQHIEQQDSVKRNLAKMAKWSTNMSEDDISQYLFRMVASFEFRETLYSGVRSLLADFQSKPINFFSGSQDEKDDLSSSSLARILQNEISSTFSSVAWSEGLTTPAHLSTGLIAIHELVFNQINRALQEGELQIWLSKQLTSVIGKFDFRHMVKTKANNLSPRKMEAIFQNLISEQLVFIELLGALLGGLSGLALVDIKIFGYFSAALASYYLIDIWLTKRRTEKLSV